MYIIEIQLECNEILRDLAKMLAKDFILEVLYYSQCFEKLHLFEQYSFSKTCTFRIPDLFTLRVRRPEARLTV